MNTSKLRPAPPGGWWNAEQHTKMVQLCERLCEKRPAKDRKKIYEAFFGVQPKVKRGRGGRRKRR